LRYDAVYLGHLGAWACPACGNARPALDVSATGVAFDGLDGTGFTLRTPLGERRVNMPLPGLYNVYNALAAVAMACAMGDVPLERMAAGLEAFGPAFGRFERVSVDGHEAVLVLSKNPAGANEVIRTLAHDPAPKRLVVALNDRIADGRDVSWIWDVDFELLTGGVESVVTSGTRAAEMAVRLKYAGVDPDVVRVEPDLAAALDTALAAGGGPAYVLTTYTAMLELRGALTRRGVVPPYWEAA
jgi:UDP-N-acetylmuramyl tripeptide synthase